MSHNLHKISEIISVGKSQQHKQNSARKFADFSGIKPLIFCGQASMTPRADFVSQFHKNKKNWEENLSAEKNYRH